MKRLFIIGLFFVGILLYAQKTVSGIVTDDFGLASEVEVLNETTGQFTITDETGQYTLSMKDGDSIMFSGSDGEMIILIAGLDDLTEVSLSDAVQIGEVVAIGYGKVDSRDLTGSITKISGEEVADKPSSNPVASLQGKVSGLSIVNSGRIGQQPDVRIRGTSSRYNAQPLYVVNGVFTDNIDFVNPNDIVSMEVLKDPSSLAIFGVAGANGVIIVTTKSADEDKLIFNLNSTIGFKSLVGEPDLANAALFKELYDERLVNEGITPFAHYDIFNGDTNWVDQITNSSRIVQTNNFSVRSASKKNSLYFGIGYREEDGLIVQEKLERINFNLNNEFKLSDNFKIGINLNGEKSKLPNQGSFDTALNATPIVDPVHQDIRKEFNGLYNQLPIEIGGAQIQNPYLRANFIKNKNISDRYRFVGSAFAELKVLKDFTFKSTFLGDYQNIESRSYTPIIDIYVGETDEIVPDNGNQITRVRQQTTNISYFQQDHILSYNKEFGKHEINATAGFTTRLREYESIGGEIQHNPAVGIIPDDPRFWYLGVYPYGDPESETNFSDQYDNATTSFLGRVLYNYRGKYLFSGSYRRDATSQLAPENREQNFWAIGLGWVMSKESFMKGFQPLSFLKLKGSMGQLGNQFTPSGYNYPYYPGVDSGATAIFGENVIPGFIARFEENPNLEWETIKSWEAGLESSWFRNRLRFNGLYYHKKTKDLLVFVDTGVEQFFDNSGEIENKGFEFEASWSDKAGDFNYSISANLTTVDNEVLETREDAAIFAGAASRTITGQPIGSFYGYIVDGIYQTYAQIDALPTSTLGSYAPGDFIYRDVNGDGKITPDDRTNIGNPTPDFMYGFNLNLGYKQIYLNMGFQGVYGNEIYRNWGNGNSFAQFNYRTARADRWTGPGTSNWEPRLYDATEYNRLPSTYMIEDGSYFRIRNIQLGYVFDPFKISGFEINQMKMYINLENVHTFRNNSGFTPEAGGSPVEFGVDNGGYPVPMVSTFGFSITF